LCGFSAWLYHRQSGVRLRPPFFRLDICCGISLFDSISKWILNGCLICVKIVKMMRVNKCVIMGYLHFIKWFKSIVLIASICTHLLPQTVRNSPVLLHCVCFKHNIPLFGFLVCISSTEIINLIKQTFIIFYLAHDLFFNTFWVKTSSKQ
jgi:hypothetical protein